MAAVIAVIAGVRPGICISPEPRPIALGHRGQMAEHRDRVLAPGLGHPDRVEAGRVGPAGQVHLLLGENQGQ